MAKTFGLAGDTPDYRRSQLADMGVDLPDASRGQPDRRRDVLRDMGVDLDAQKKQDDIYKRQKEAVDSIGRAFDELSRKKKEAAEAEIKKEEEYQKLLKGRIESLETAKRLKADMAKLEPLPGWKDKLSSGAGALGQGLLGAGLGPLGTLLGGNTALGSQASMIARGGLSTLNSGVGMAMAGIDPETGYDPKRFHLNFQRKFMGAFGLSSLQQAHEATAPEWQGQKNISEAKRTLRELEMRLPIVANRDVQQRAVLSEEARYKAQGKFGFTSAGAQFGITTAVTGREEAALARAGGLAGIGRETEQADIHRRAALERGLGTQSVEAQRQLKISDAERTEARRQKEELQEKVKAQMQAAASAAANLSAAQEARGKRASSSTIGLWLGGRPGKSDEKSSGEQLEERRLKNEQEIARLTDLQRQLQAAVGKELAANAGHMEKIKQLQGERLGLLRQEYSTVTARIQAERARKQGLRENFGLMAPLQRHGFLQIARKIKGGQQLSQSEIERAGQSELFRPALQKIGARRAGPEFDEIKKLLGTDKQEKQLEGERIKLEQRIQVEIKTSEAQLADELAKKVLPVIQQQNQNLFDTAKAALDRLALQLRNQWRAAAGG